MISRAQVINGLFELFSDDLSYLEIGVSLGETFFDVKAQKKMAVDPNFQFSVSDARAKHIGSEFYQMTSDFYFANIINSGDTFQIIFLDGLHTFEQTLRDFTNAIRFLAPDGIIVIDDVVPNSYHASLPDQRAAFKVKEFVQNSDDSWMGDTFKLVFFIESFFPTYKLRTISDNHGQAIVWAGSRASTAVTTFTLKTIADLQFLDVIEQEGFFYKKSFLEIREEITRERRSVA